MFDFQCSPDVSLQDPDVSFQKLSSGWISEPQRGATVGVGIIRKRRHVRFSVLSRRLPPGSRLRLDFRAPERGNSSRWNHSPAASRISAPAGFTSPSFSARCWFWLCFRVPKESKSQETHEGFSGRVTLFGIRGAMVVSIVYDSFVFWYSCYLGAGSGEP